jgi:hypothetical protein
MRRITYSCAALIGVALTIGTPAMSSGSHGSGSVSAGTHVVLTMNGRGVDGDTSGTFTLAAAKGVASDTGTMHAGANITGPPPQPVPGYLGWKGTAEGHGELRGKHGGLWLALSESFISVNASSVYTVVSTGTWRIARGTGVYKSWKGSGQFVSTGRHAPTSKDRPSGGGPYEARFVGVVTR